MRKISYASSILSNTVPCQSYSLPTLGHFAGQADTVAAAAAEGLVGAWWYSVAVATPVPFVLESSPAGVSKGKDNIVGCETPSINSS